MPARALRTFLLAACLAGLAGLAVTDVVAATARGDDTLAATMAGEFAFQGGRLDEASDWYLRAAHASGDDAGLAERAARIALLANDDERAAEALALWRKRAPESLAMRGASATLALRRS